jgi:hypothetical protein
MMKDPEFQLLSKRELTNIGLIVEELISSEVSAQLTNLAASYVEVDIQIVLAEGHVEVVQLIGCQFVLETYRKLVTISIRVF